MGDFISFTKIQLKVLVVEDNHIIRTSLAQLFDNHFQHTYYADNGKMGLELYLEHKPDVVFTDIAMPGMDGIEMLYNIKEQSDQMPMCIILSAFENPNSTRSFTGLKIFKTIKKPFNFSELEKLVAEISEHHNLPE